MLDEITENEFLEIERINRIYQNQINRLDDISVLDKELFNLSIGLDISDWAIIRTKKYYENIAKMSNYQQKQYLIHCLKHYINVYK